MFDSQQIKSKIAWAGFCLLLVIHILNRPQTPWLGLIKYCSHAS